MHDWAHGCELLEEENDGEQAMFGMAEWWYAQRRPAGALSGQPSPFNLPENINLRWYLSALLFVFTSLVPF